jgi:hypothetical protein
VEEFWSAAYTNFHEPKTSGMKLERDVGWAKWLTAHLNKSIKGKHPTTPSFKFKYKFKFDVHSLN